MKTVFSGEEGLAQFLNPSSHCTPIVELPAKLNPYHQDGVRIFAKLTSHLPLMNIKSIPVFHMLQQTDLRDTHMLIENSSGNTAYSLSILSKLFGINSTTALISHEITQEKFRLLQLFGLNMIVNKENICPNPADKRNGIVKAKKLGEQPGRLNLGQYDNPLNIQGYETLTAPQIYKQMKGNIQIFACSLGTTGSLIGHINYLKKKKAEILSLGVVRKPNNPVPGPRTKKLLQHIAFPREDSVDVLVEESSKKAYLQSLLMMRSGLLVGPSSGLVLAGIFSFLKEQKKLNL